MQNIVSFFAVDNTTENDKGVQNLRQKIVEVLKDDPYIPQEVPLRYEGQFYPISIVFCSSNHYFYLLLFIIYFAINEFETTDFLNLQYAIAIYETYTKTSRISKQFK